MTGMVTQEHQIDLGHLMAFDPLHHFPSPPASRLGFLFFTPAAGFAFYFAVFFFLFSFIFIHSFHFLAIGWFLARFRFDVCEVPWNRRPNFKTRVIWSKFELHKDWGSSSNPILADHCSFWNLLWRRPCFMWLMLRMEVRILGQYHVEVMLVSCIRVSCNRGFRLPYTHSNVRI